MTSSIETSAYPFVLNRRRALTRIFCRVSDLCSGEYGMPYSCLAQRLNSQGVDSVAHSALPDQMSTDAKGQKMILNIFLLSANLSPAHGRRLPCSIWLAPSRPQASWCSSPTH